MYTSLRNVHLALGLLSSAFLLAYGVSAVQMSHPSWFELGRSYSKTSITIPAIESPRAVAKLLMDQHDLRGDLMDVKTTSTAIHLRIVRPGVVHKVDIDPQTGSAAISTERGGLLHTLNRIHHINGMWHDYWVTNAWAWFLAVVSVALFGTGLTGLYLWYRRTADRKIGLVMIALSLGWGGSLLFLVRLSG